MSNRYFQHYSIHPNGQISQMRNGPSFRLRMVEMRRDFWVHLVQPPCLSRDNLSRLPRTTSRYHLTFSKVGDPSLSGQLQRSNAQSSLIVKKYFLMFRPSFLSAKWITSLTLLPTLLMQPRTPLAHRSKDKLLARVQLGPKHIHRSPMKFLSAYFSSLLNSF